MVNVLKFCTPKFLTKWQCRPRSSLIRVYTICDSSSSKYFKKQLHKKQNLGKKIWKKVFKISGHSYCIYIYISFIFSIYKFVKKTITVLLETGREIKCWISQRHFKHTTCSAVKHW